MKTLAIATVTVRETLNRKIQVTLLIFAVLLVVATYVATLLTVGASHRMVADLGLSGMELVSVLLATFLGADLVAGDVQRRVIYPVVAKPVSRTQYLLGRYLGLSATLALNLLAMAVMLSALFVYDARSFSPLSPTLAGAIALLLLKVLTVAAIATLFSSFTNTTLASIFTLSLTIAGYLTSEVRSIWQGDHAWISALVWYALPDLGTLTGNEAVVYRTALPASAALGGLHALAYAAAMLALAAAVLERRDFR
ncbi:ABC transporter permease [Anaeromyxobacter sp. SG17]|uniref:ABC transporter permease n=1 Tax=Anaeromyxobacter sp. SG17 TaxID=2925405 RepID=UPI001F5836B3|nr:ABC transporter permease subunit [Anaeromyxobacter sp. SG17]